MDEKEIMTVKQLAEYLQMDGHTVYRLARAGQIPSVKIAGQWRFKKYVVDKWISEESLERISQNKKSLSVSREKEGDKKEKLLFLANECAKALKEKYGVKKVVLVGSLIKGSLHHRSDIDLMVEGLPSTVYIKALTELYDLLPPRVELDLIPYEDAFESLKGKMIKEGKILYA